LASNIAYGFFRIGRGSSRDPGVESALDGIASNPERRDEESGAMMPVFCGNGLKSVGTANNMATQRITQTDPARRKDRRIFTALAAGWTRVRPLFGKMKRP